MNKMIFTIFLLFLVVPVHGDANEQSPWKAKLPFKQATIQYVISGVENGSEERYIKDFGREIATYHTTQTKMMGMVMDNKTFALTTPEYSYSYDLTNRSGTKSVNPEKYMLEEYNKLSKPEKDQVRKNGEELGVSVVQGVGGKVETNAKTILGYSCDKTEMMGTTSYSIHGTAIPLYVESNMMGMKMKIEAKAVKVGAVADAYFQLPEGIEPYFDPQSDAMARSMAVQTISMLKDPKAVQKMQAEGQQQQTQLGEGMTPEQQQQMEQAMEAMQGLLGGPKQQD